jgi:hypothetical protein
VIFHGQRLWKWAIPDMEIYEMDEEADGLFGLQKVLWKRNK